MKQLQLFAPAKLNLTLAITGSRLDGYHLIRSVMQAVDLGDTVTVALADGKKVEVTCDNPAVPCDESNVACRAARAFFRAGGRSGGVRVNIRKKIPIFGGLGGSSADGAAVLVGLNELLGTGYTVQKLCEIGATVGADLPFCIVGSTQLCEGIGELITPLPALPFCYIVLAQPGEGVSTAHCFSRFDESPPSEYINGESLERALFTRDLKSIGAGMHNMLLGSSGISEIPKLCGQMLADGALGASMTGSGSAVFGIFDDEGLAKACLKKLADTGNWARLTKPVQHGVRVLDRR